MRLPARLTVEDVAQLLGFGAHDIPRLVKAKLLRPLGGSNRRNSVKYFSAVEIEGYARDAKWLDRATNAISRSRSPAS